MDLQLQYCQCTADTSVTVLSPRRWQLYSCIIYELTIVCDNYAWQLQHRMLSLPGVLLAAACSCVQAAVTYCVTACQNRRLLRFAVWSGCCCGWSKSSLGCSVSPLRSTQY